jgi:hypothetical protein|tara:strand:- start:323 stop:478 length:156 start_codon:yes stop_codon:yes gene_type:complete
VETHAVIAVVFWDAVAAAERQTAREGHLERAAKVEETAVLIAATEARIRDE